MQNTPFPLIRVHLRNPPPAASPVQPPLRARAYAHTVQRRHHYECAFEEYLRSRRIPYVAVDEARKALLPAAVQRAVPGGGKAAIKSFDFVVYGENTNLLVDIKGRRVEARSGRGGRPTELATGTLQSWVTHDDVESMGQWEGLFGSGFEAAFVFIYWCAAQPPDALFQEVFQHKGEWYALRSVRRCDYVRAMRPRSAKWRTVYVPARDFERISQPFVGRAPAVDGGDGLLHDHGPVEPALAMLGG